MSHGNPPARSLRALVVIELHRGDEVAGDRSPLLVGQGALVGSQRQRAVPHVAALDVHVVRGTRAVEVTRDRQCRIAA